LQPAIAHENWARDSRTHGQFRDGSKDKERGNVRLVEEGLSSDDDAKVCVAEWVNTPKDKLITCMFLKSGPPKRKK
jgi:hypothetical protein